MYINRFFVAQVKWFRRSMGKRNVPNFERFRVQIFSTLSIQRVKSQVSNYKILEKLSQRLLLTGKSAFVNY